MIAIGTLTLITVALLSVRRAVAERTIRWRLYAIRDELRGLAWTDRRLLDTVAFNRMDAGISTQCSVLPDVSMWSLLPVFALDEEGREAIEERQMQLAKELREPNNAEVSRLFDRSVGLMIQHLLWRHMFLTLIAGVTLFGLFGVYFCAKWASERIISGALKPVLSGGGSGVAPRSLGQRSFRRKEIRNYARGRDGRFNR